MGVQGRYSSIPPGNRRCAEVGRTWSATLTAKRCMAGVPAVAPALMSGRTRSATTFAGSSVRARVPLLLGPPAGREPAHPHPEDDRKSTRLNSSHSSISYAVFCLKKKKKHIFTYNLKKKKKKIKIKQKNKKNK